MLQAVLAEWTQETVVHILCSTLLNLVLEFVNLLFSFNIHVYIYNLHFQFGTDHGLGCFQMTHKQRQLQQINPSSLFEVKIRGEM